MTIRTLNAEQLCQKFKKDTVCKLATLCIYPETGMLLEESKNETVQLSVVYIIYITDRGFFKLQEILN